MNISYAMKNYIIVFCIVLVFHVALKRLLQDKQQHLIVHNEEMFVQAEEDDAAIEQEDVTVSSLVVAEEDEISDLDRMFQATDTIKLNTKEKEKEKAFDELYEYAIVKSKKNEMNQLSSTLSINNQVADDGRAYSKTTTPVTNGNAGMINAYVINEYDKENVINGGMLPGSSLQGYDQLSADYSEI